MVRSPVMNARSIIDLRIIPAEPKEPIDRDAVIPESTGVFS
jgi:hypothetical protein